MNKHIAIAFSLLMLTACTSTDSIKAIHLHSQAVKLTGAEVAELIVGKKVTLPDFDGVISYFADGRYVYDRKQNTFRGTYRIQGTHACAYFNGKKGVCGEYFKLDDKYYWNNPRKRDVVSVVSSIESLDETATQ